jgi:hypothetical protein
MHYCCYSAATQKSMYIIDNFVFYIVIFSLSLSLSRLLIKSFKQCTIILSFSTQYLTKLFAIQLLFFSFLTVCKYGPTV